MLGWDGLRLLLTHVSLSSSQYLEVLRSHQNRPAKCLTVLWALGQAGFADLHEGLKGESLERWAGRLSLPRGLPLPWGAGGKPGRPPSTARASLLPLVLPLGCVVCFKTRCPAAEMLERGLQRLAGPWGQTAPGGTPGNWGVCSCSGGTLGLSDACLGAES